jgi:hypothetical protein
MQSQVTAVSATHFSRYRIQTQLRVSPQNISAASTVRWHDQDQHNRLRGLGSLSSGKPGLELQTQRLELHGRLQTTPRQPFSAEDRSHFTAPHLNEMMKVFWVILHRQNTLIWASMGIGSWHQRFK